VSCDRLAAGVPCTPDQEPLLGAAVKNLSLLDRLILGIGAIAVVQSMLFTIRHSPRLVMSVALVICVIIAGAWLSKIASDLQARCDRYERALREHGIDPADLPVPRGPAEGTRR